MIPCVKDRAIITTSWDDGGPLDLKLAKMLKKNGIPATFYFPVRNNITECLDNNQKKEIAKDFDIGAHTLSHVNLTKISLKQAQKEVFECKRELEKILQKEVKLFCYPWGAYNNCIIDIVKKAGFQGARTTRYFDTRIKDPFQIGTTIKAYDERIKFYYIMRYFSSGLEGDSKLFLFLIKNGLLYNNWYEITMNVLNYVVNYGGILHLWGHSFEINRQNNWEKLDLLFKKVKEVTKRYKVLLMDNTQVLNYVKNLVKTKL